MSEDRDERIVELAIQAAGIVDSKWSDRVTALVPRVAALFREPHDEADPTSLINTARKVAEASAFTAEYRDHELDDSGRDGNRPTQRVFVRIYDEKSQGDNDYLDADGCQTVRTEPMWSGSGRAVRSILESMESGQRAVFYRYTEQIDRKRKQGLLVHVQPLRTRAAPGQTTHPPSRPPARQASEEPRPSSDAAPSPEPARTGRDPHGIIEERFEALTARQRVAFMRLCRETGVPTPLICEDDKIEQVMANFDTVAGES